MSFKTQKSPQTTNRPHLFRLVFSLTFCGFLHLFQVLLLLLGFLPMESARLHRLQVQGFVSVALAVRHAPGLTSSLSREVAIDDLRHTYLSVERRCGSVTSVGLSCACPLAMRPFGSFARRCLTKDVHAAFMLLRLFERFTRPPRFALQPPS